MPYKRKKPTKPILSPTKFSTYLECALKYRYIYVDRIGRYYMRARPQSSLGGTLHRVLEEFHRKSGLPEASQLTHWFEDRWVTAGYESPQQEAESHAAGLEMIQAYHSANSQRVAEGIDTLFTEKWLRADMGPFILAGRVDRLDRHPDGTFEIVDYKSGRWETTAEDVAADLAMNIYELIVRMIYPGNRVIGTIYCLRSGIHASAEMPDEQATDFAGEIRVLGEEIISRDYDGVRPVRIETCGECEFLRRCERYWQWEANRDLLVD